MENSVGKLSGTKNYKKTRSLDLKSLYKSKESKVGNNKSNSVAGDGGESGKKRKSRKEVSLSSFKKSEKGSRKSLDELENDKLNPGSRNDNVQHDLSHKLNCNNGLNSISLTLDDKGEVISIPKRRRGSVGCKKFERKQVLKSSGLPKTEALSSSLKFNGESKKVKDNHVVKPSRSSCSKIDSGNRLDKSNGDPVATVCSSKIGLQTDDNANRNSKVKLAGYDKEDDNPVVVNSKALSYKKRKRNHRKKKDLAIASDNVAKDVISSVDNHIKISGDFPDDDEENLEQNAARMLSSRFDPSCTGFPSKSKHSSSPSSHDLPFLSRSSKDCTDQRENTFDDLDLASVEAGSRVLRPRKQSKEKGLLRKRRRFYEIVTKDLDAYWLLNRRIKIFWPLDESWYYGLVNDYDPERDLHHIKYDDRDEEWINLQNERFKLLVFPSEISYRTGARKYALDDDDAVKKKGGDSTWVDDYMENHMESEPIISWLARSSHRSKSSSFGVMKKQKTSHSSSSFVPQLLPDTTVDAHVPLNVGSSERDTGNTPSLSALLDELPDAGKGKKSAVESTSSSRSGKVPVVYFRRRFRKKGERMFQMSEENNVCEHAAVNVTSPAFDTDSLHASEENVSSCGYLDPGKLWWSTNIGGVLTLTILLSELKKHRFQLVPLVRKYTFGAEYLELFNSLMLLQYGTVSQTWPMVHLEIFFVDSVMGLRLLLFEGSLKQAIDFVLLVLNVFSQHREQGKYVELPVTSIRFKISCFQDLKKQYVFTFYCFSKVKSSKWMDLDNKLQRRCLLTRQLPLSECTYDNMQAFEGGSNLLQTLSVSDLSASKGLHKKCSGEDVVKESFNVNMSKSSMNFDLKQRTPPSFAAAPTSFLSLHLKLLMDNSVACVSLQNNKATCSVEHSENSFGLIADDSTSAEGCSENASEISSRGNMETSLEGVYSLCGNDNRVKTSWNSEDGNINLDETSACKHSGQSDAVVLLQSCKNMDSEHCGTLSHPFVPNGHVSPKGSDNQCYSIMNNTSFEISPFHHAERPVVLESHSGQFSTDLNWSNNDEIVRSPNPTGHRSMSRHSRNSLSFSSHGEFPYLLSDKKKDFIGNGFGSGPKRPRTQVQYTVPFGGFDNNSKHKVHDQKSSYKRIRIANEKRSSDGSRSSKRNLELLACDANVLITLGDRGWRECGAQVVLELADHNEWRLAVKFSGTIKHWHKVSHILQPGTTNRYTHAMMWKGEKDWALEFPDRTQWMLFKEMHEECYNRNIRAASVKHIPIPGVRLIEESDDNGAEVPFSRCSSQYFLQVDTDVDMAINPTRFFYDMDSDDEQWILDYRKSLGSHESKCDEISEELFEKIMDMFEKFAYAQQCDHFTSAEIEELMVGVGPMEVIKVIHEHWQQKRQRKGMPLIRHFQPPLWERYQQQVREWEQEMTKANTAISNGAAPHVEKPPMFAFCLKPRGLELPTTKGSKQRSQRKHPVSWHRYSVVGDQDSVHAFGRRSKGYMFGDDKLVYPRYSHESSSDYSPLPHASRGFSPRGAGHPGYFSLNGGYGGSKFLPRRNKSKKSPNNSHILSSPSSFNNNQRPHVVKRNVVVDQWRNLGEWSSSTNQKLYKFEGGSSLRHHHGMMMDGSDLDEFRLRDASGAAQHALNMAKLKREKAQRLLYRADLAINKAVVSLMNAEAVKSSFDDDSKDDG